MSTDAATGPSRRTLLAAGAALLPLAACGSPSSAPAPPPVTTPVPTTPAADWQALAGRLSEGLLRPGDRGWDPAGLLYNPRFAAAGHPVPQAVAACRTVDDVRACVEFAAAGGAPLRVRAGGHSYGGWSVGEGLVADLSPLADVVVDPGAGTATVGAGARLVDVYAAVGAHGVAVGAGSCPTVGFSGLALGGGVGVLAPSFGLTCDQVRSADVVTADGRARTVGADSADDADRDLFWALRGGGAGLAVVTSWTLAVRPAPDVSVVVLRWPLEAAADVVARWQDWAAAGPRELWSTCKVLADPAGGSRAQVSGVWTGSGSLDGVLAPLLADLPAPAATSRRTLGYLDAMLHEAGCSRLDAAACTARALDDEHRRPFAATSSVLREALPADGVRALADAVRAVDDAPPAGLLEAGVSLDVTGGAVDDVAPGATAYPWRGALATVQHTATWTGARPAGPFDAVVAGSREALRPWTGAAAYVNYADPGQPDRGRACWGDNLDRLQRVAAAVDPDGVLASPAGVPRR